jgi:hypothetical protein
MKRRATRLRGIDMNLIINILIVFGCCSFAAATLLLFIAVLIFSCVALKDILKK